MTKIGNIRITSNEEHPMGWVTNLDGEIIKGVVAARLDLTSDNFPKAEIDLVCQDFDIEAKLIKANVTIVKNSPNVLKQLDHKLSWLRLYFKDNPKDLDKFDAALNDFTFMGKTNKHEAKQKFVNIFRHAPYENMDYASDLIEDESES